METKELRVLRDLRHRLAGELKQLEAKEDGAIRNHDSETALRYLAESIGLKKAVAIVREEIQQRADTAVF